MSKTTAELENLVATIIANRPEGDVRPTARQRANIDRAFAAILKLIAPRIRHFIRQYGLMAHWDDAEQAASIGIHRAIEAYDPSKAQFTTFVNWQIRGELQSLRFRLMTDQRSSAKKVEATTVSIHAGAAGADGDETSLEAIIEDEDALANVEAGASDYLASRATSSLLDAYVAHLRQVGIEQLKRRPRLKRPDAALSSDNGGEMRPRLRGVDPAELAALDERLTRNREIIVRRLFQLAEDTELDQEMGLTKERVRQIAKRATKTLAELTGSDPRFLVMADYPVANARTRSKRKGNAIKTPSASLMPEMGQPANLLTRVVAITAQEGSDLTRGRAIEETLPLDPADAGMLPPVEDGLGARIYH